MVKLVENKISDTLPECFCIAFDCWLSFPTKYVCYFATFPSDNDLRFSKVLINCSPVANEIFQDDQEHQHFFNRFFVFK